jgi:SAM-dependent methyltransferase
VGKAGQSDRQEAVLTTPFEEFAREHLPAPPARVLDVGCGRGELTTALSVAGYDVLGIDPIAPVGALFRRLKLEDVESSESFDAVVARYSLHHIRDLDAALDKIAELLPSGGVVAVDEFGWDRLDDTTLDWLYGQRRALAAAGHGNAPASREELRRDWSAEYLGLHGFSALREALDARFDELAFTWVPFLHRKLAGVATEVLEQALIDAGAIQALGFRYAGVVRPR